MSDLPQPSVPHTLNSHNHSTDTATDSHNGDNSTSNDMTEASMAEKAGDSAITEHGETLEARLSRLLGEKEKVMAAVVQRPGPLNLLNLPLDILTMIVKEITHTNDLTAVAMCHSALHDLAIPHIYSRFDIVWPDNTTDTAPRSGVDALTYGLATLVMGEDVFGEAQFQRQVPQYEPEPPAACVHCGHASAPTTYLPITPSPPLPTYLQPRAKRKRRGNYYASFTRKFSLGNGPADWVQEYMVTKEGGKMLGTLVALALARMRNLETFVWDMPTGILRDVWIALASLGDREEGDYSRLEKVWVRWHDNARVDGNEEPPKSPYHQPNTFPQPISSVHGATTLDQATLRLMSVNKVERPSFSILPPLKSLNVLDLDELAYLDEMSVLMSRSKHCLRELRVGIAKQSSGCDWTGNWAGGGLQQLPAKDTDPLSGTSHLEKRLGGVLGVLVGHVYNIEQHRTQSPGTQAQTNASRDTSDSPQSSTNTPSPMVATPSTEVEAESSGLDLSGAGSPSQQTSKSNIPTSKWGPLWGPLAEDLPPSDATQTVSSKPNGPSLDKGWTKINYEPRQQSNNNDGTMSKGDDQMFALHILELERVPLSITVLCGAFDWTKLRELTLLDCPNHEHLWKALRKRFSPKCSSTSLHEDGTLLSSSKVPKPPIPDASDYVLNLRKVHTNTVTTSLIAFLKEALAPNTLETLFLQQSIHYTSKVGMDAIFKGAIRQHRSSLKHLSIDSRTRGRDDDHPAVGYKKWAFDREVLSFVTSGKMSKLRELAMSIDGKDWHFLLQRLPSVPHLRALHIPFVIKEPPYVIADHDAKELALQIIDIITLRPEIELCYLGIASKCFEILETRQSDRDCRFGGSSDSSAANAMTSDEDDDDADADADDDAAEDEEDADDADDGAGGGGGAGGVDAANAEEGDETETEEEGLDGDDHDSDYESEAGKTQLRLKLREILFYDDKVAIFKARHGRL